MVTSFGSKSKTTLRWLKDETFYSLCSRQHHFLGHSDTFSTLTWLYGSNPRAITHDLPGNLDALNDHVIASLGDAKSIISHHTILPIFSPFQSAANIAAAELSMRSPSIGALKYRLGLLTGRFGAEHPLKACILCMTDDRLAHGVAYWHLNHQYPGVMICPTHRSFLRTCMVNRQWTGRFKWGLPTEDLLDPGKPETELSALLEHYGAAVLELASYGMSTHFNPSRVCTVYREALGKLGSSRSARAKAVRSLARHISHLQPFFPFTQLPATEEHAASFIARMTRRSGGLCHPLKHLTLITWLYDGLGPFVQAYEGLPPVRTDNQEKPINEIAMLATIQPDRQVNADHLKINRRPKKLKPIIRADIIDFLRSGESKENICTRFKLTICTINRLLRSEPALRKIWTTRQLDFKRAKNRSEWTRAVATEPSHCPKSIRKIIPCIYAWLYRHDKAWLLSQTGVMRSGRTGNYSAVDWELRDNTLLAKIKFAIGRQREEKGFTQLTMRSINDLVPRLYLALEKRKYYPKTQLFLSKILGKA
jgi:hypothetical protein